MADMPLDPDMIPEMFAPTTDTEWGVLWALDERGPWRIAEGGVAEALENASDLLQQQRLRDAADMLYQPYHRGYERPTRDVPVYTRAILSDDAAWPKEYPYTDLRPVEDVLGPVVTTMIED